jgi:cytochrome oxidase assembly protein ShyY1
VYRFLWSRQWVALTLLGLVMMPTMYKLGFWQLHRHERKVADNHLVGRNLDAAPVSIEKITAPGRRLTVNITYRTVKATGHYDLAHEMVARQRTATEDGDIGYHVITPLVLADGEAVLVDRGWIPANGNITRFPKVPEPPTGTVTVTGRLRPDETTHTTGIHNRTGLPPRQIMLINSTLLDKQVPEKLLSGYMELTSTTPKPQGHQPELLPAPDHSDIGMHLGYAIQWWLFTVMVPVAWVILVRREKRERLAEAAKAKKAAAKAAKAAQAEPADKAAKAADAALDPGKPDPGKPAAETESARV